MTKAQHLALYHAWSDKCEAYPMCDIQEGIDAEVQSLKSWWEFVKRLTQTSEKK